MKVYLVGGAVRDRLLGRTPRERDWVVVGGSEQQLLDQGLKRVGHAFPVFIDPKNGEEYALARRESKVSTGHQGFSFDTSSGIDLETDLRRRDLTINAMAEADGRIIDPFGGKKDLENRILRHVSAAFVEDPLRVLRVARICAELRDFGFEVCQETLDLMRHIAESGELQNLTRERIWGEVAKAANTRWLDVFLQVLAAAQCLGPWFAECGFTDAEHHLLGGWQRQLPSPVSRLAALGGLLDHQDTERLMQRIAAPKRFARAAVVVARAAPALRNWQAAEIRNVYSAFHLICKVKPEAAKGEILHSLALVADMPIALLKNREQQFNALRLDGHESNTLGDRDYGSALQAKRQSLIAAWRNESY